VVQHAHETARWSHRDIKPETSVNRAGSQIKVIDMGLARLCHDEETSDEEYEKGHSWARPIHRPEQALDSLSGDPSADISTLGCTFYFCRHGHTPFTEGRVAQKLAWHQTRAPTPIRPLRARGAEGLAAPAPHRTWLLALCSLQRRFHGG